MKVYVNAKSKKAINESLTEGRTIRGVNHSFFGDGGTYTLNAELPAGTVIAVYEKYSGGSPVAKAWGTWDGKKVK